MTRSAPPCTDESRGDVGLRPVLGYSSIPDYLHRAWTQRSFAWVAARGAMSASNQNTLMGSLWHLLNPLLLAAVYYLIFGVIFSASRDTDNFVTFLVCGLFTFFFTRKCVQAGARSMVGNQSLLTSLRFPRVLLPVSSVVQEGMSQLPTYVVLLAIAWMTGEQPGLMWLALLPLVAVQSVFNLGMALFAARATFHFQDTQQFLPYAMRLWMYLSGAMYPASYVYDRTEGLVALLFTVNPAYVFIRATRQVVLDHQFDTALWAGAMAWSAVALVAGFRFFYRRESEYSRA